MTATNTLLILIAALVAAVVIVLTAPDPEPSFVDLVDEMKEE